MKKQMLNKQLYSLHLENNKKKGKSMGDNRPKHNV
jgi:hypothetical protein